MTVIDDRIRVCDLYTLAAGEGVVDNILVTGGSNQDRAPKVRLAKSLGAPRLLQRDN
jgi:hypothetical protein